MKRLARAVLRLFAAPRLNVQEDYEKVRKLQRQLAARPLPRYKTLDRTIMSEDGTHQIPVRVFQPKEQRRDEVLLFFHGGGWVTGDIESYTPACANLAEATGCVVASVDYRLAPEYPFPGGLEDCYRVASLVLKTAERLGIDDPDNVVLVGDSAGGNLAAVVSLMLRDNGMRIPSRQILLYPVTHWDHNPETSPYESVRRHGNDYRLTNTEVQDYFDLYVPDIEVRKGWKVAPIVADDLSRQPRTLMMTAELDLLRDEAEDYAERLRDAGNTVQVHRVEGAIHGFIQLPRFAKPLREAYVVINEFLDGADSAEGQDS